MNSFPFLTTLVLLPAGTAVVLAILPTDLGERRLRISSQVIGLVGALATLALAVVIAVRFNVHDAGYQMVSDHIWARAVGVSWYLGIDGISLFLVLLAALIFPIALVGARTRTNLRSYMAWMLFLEAVCIGSFISLDLILFFVFFEASLVPIYFIITGWGFEKRTAAAMKFFIYTFLGSAFLFVGMVVLALIHQHQTGVLTFSLPALAHTHLPYYVQVLLFLSFTVAFAVKAPVFPFHTWSPDAYAEAPTGGSVVLAAIMAKMGTYGIIRFDLNLFPKVSIDLAPLLLTLGVAGIIYGAIVACTQKDLKRMVAYSSLSHIGFIVLGVFALTSEGLAGGVIQMVNHGLIIAVLFLAIGWIYERTSSWNLSRLKGLQKPAPLLAAVFTIGMLAAIGLPGLNGFVGEFLILIGTFIVHRWWAVVAAAGVVLAALYMLWAYQQAFHGKPDEQIERHTKDISWPELIVMAPLVAIIVFLGVYPKPVLDRITPSVERLVKHADAAAGIHQPKLSRKVALPATLPATKDRKGTGAGYYSVGSASSTKNYFRDASSSSYYRYTGSAGATGTAGAVRVAGVAGMNGATTKSTFAAPGNSVVGNTASSGAGKGTAVIHQSAIHNRRREAIQ
ncbi:MAG: NADH-quinone oxidoreductase subunit M [Actinobacteria bacterium]|nr:NADH-quinone oxidoreductase subunit M [Actinomycetota bacterium]